MPMTVIRLRPLLTACALVLFAACQPLAEMALAASAESAAQPSSAPTFQVDPFWPQELPGDWLLGNVVGVATDSSDNVWIIHRPNSQRGAENTPPVIAFDPAGAVVHAWGGPGEGYDWGTQTHGIHVDHDDNVWVGFGGGLPYDLTTRATTDNAHVLKFTPEGRVSVADRRLRPGHGGQQQHRVPRPADRCLRGSRSRRGLHQRRVHEPAGRRFRRGQRRVPAALERLRQPAGRRRAAAPVHARQAAAAAVQHAALRRARRGTAGSTSATAGTSGSRYSSRMGLSWPRR